MDKESVLSMSRKEPDEGLLNVGFIGGKTEIELVTVIAVFFIIADALTGNNSHTVSALYGVMIIIQMYSYYRSTSKKHYLLISVVWGLMSILFTVTYRYKLVNG